MFWRNQTHVELEKVPSASSTSANQKYCSSPAKSTASLPPRRKLQLPVMLAFRMRQPKQTAVVAPQSETVVHRASFNSEETDVSCSGWRKVVYNKVRKAWAVWTFWSHFLVFFTCLKCVYRYNQPSCIIAASVLTHHFRY